MYKKPNIISCVKVRRLVWVGHVIKMEYGRAVKAVYMGSMAGRRGRGRPRLRWGDQVQEDIRGLGVKRWMWKAEDRREWLKIIKEAKAKP